MIKAAFFDLDGTLFPQSTGICSEKTKHALHALRRKGILIFAATGRAPYELNITKMLDGIEFDAIVALNGQYCYNDRKVIHKKLFDQDDLERMIAYTKTNPIPCAVVESDLITLNYVDDKVRHVLGTIHTPVYPIRDMEQARDKEVLMLMLYGERGRVTALEETVLPNSVITSWNDFGFDIVPKGCGKAAGIACVLQEYGLTPEEAVAFGDGENDLEMLRYVKTGVAMANASPELLRGEFYITGSAEEDGIVSALKHFALI